MKTISVLLLFIAIFHPLDAFSKEEIKLNLECSFTGLTFDGEVSSKPFNEVFKNYTDVNETGKFKGFGIVKTEFHSQGTKYDLEFTSTTSDYAVASYSKIIGKGLGRKLLVFTYIFDLQALEVDRVVTSVPKGMDERTHAICKSIK